MKYKAELWKLRVILYTSTLYTIVAVNFRTFEENSTLKQIPKDNDCVIRGMFVNSISPRKHQGYLFLKREGRHG